MSKKVKAEFALSDAGKFPLESCREKLARRYGEAAVCLSGPCEGKGLADCVCQQLKSRWATVEQRFAGDQSKVEKLAMKLADTFMEKDESQKECVADLTNLGFDKTAASGIADWLKVDAMPKRMDEVFAQMMNDVGGVGMNMGGEVETAGGMPGGPQMAGGMPGGPQMAGGAPDVGMDSGMGGMDSGMGDDMVDMPLGDLSLPGGDAPMTSPDMGGGMGGMDEGMGGMGDTVTIDLPSDVVDELLNALEGHGHSGGMDTGMGGMDSGMGGGDAEIIGDDDDMGGDDSEMVVDLDSGDSDDVVPGEPKDEQSDDGQVVTNDGDDDGDDKDFGNPFGGGDKKKDSDPDEEKHKEEAMALRAGHLTRVGQTVLKLGPEMSINNTDQQAGGKDLGTAKSKDVESPKALEDGNVHPDGFTAGGNKFQDGKTMGAEEKFSPKSVEESEYTKMNTSLMGKEKSPDFKSPSIPAGGGKIGNEPDNTVNLSTKGTVIATIVPDGIIVVTPEGKRFHAQRDLTKVASNEAEYKKWVTKLSSLLGEIKYEGDGRKFAKAAHKAMKLAENSFNTEGVTKIDTAKKEGDHFQNDAEKKPVAGGAMVGNGGAKQDTDTPTTDTSKKESEHFQNDSEKKPEEGGAMATKASAGKGVKVAGEDKKDKAEGNVVSDVGKEIGGKKPMDEQVEVEGHTAGGNKFQDGGKMGAEESFKAEEVKESDVSSMSTSLMGKEKSPDFKNPKVPVGTDHPEENYKPEGDVKIKGTVIAENQSTKREVDEAVAKVQNEAKVREGRLVAASVYVADLLSNREISTEQYGEELEKYSKLPVQAIQALAMSTRKARERILGNVKATADSNKVAGLMQPLVMGSTNDTKETLTQKISGLFTLTRGIDRLQDDDEMKRK